MKKALTVFHLFLFAVTLSAQPKLATKTIVTGLDTPWEILWGSDNWLWVSERQGKISRVNPTTGENKLLLTLSDVREVGEGGLLGMVLHPDFSKNPYLYVAYNYIDNGVYKEKIVRYTYDAATEKLDKPFILMNDITSANNHNGCRMIISPDKKLIFTTGDAQNTSTSQNVKSLNGKTLRINLDGTIPSDNPIANSPVWSWGHRNAQGLVFSPDGEKLYSSEHGANNDDELNIIKKGRNYGWPRVEGFCDNALETTFCKDSNVVEPIHAWTPTLGVAGITFYNSNLIGEWKNSILVVSLKGSRLTQLALDAKGEKVVKANDFFNNTYGRLRSVCVSPAGKVYIGVSNRDGRGIPRPDDDKIVEISSESVATQELPLAKSLHFYPNPVYNTLNINYLEKIDSNSEIDIYNILGQKVLSQKIEPTIDVHSLTEGVYYVMLLSKEGQLLGRGSFVRKN
jgi:aldose sugar dehydrogenase